MNDYRSIPHSGSRLGEMGIRNDFVLRRDHRTSDRAHSSPLGDRVAFQNGNVRSVGNDR